MASDRETLATQPVVTSVDELTGAPATGVATGVPTHGMSDQTSVEARPVAAVSAPPRYRMESVIGRGGMGEVVSARDEQIGRAVAIKRMTSDDPSPAAIARVLREARIQGRLEHPAVVPVHELWRDGRGQPFFVMKQLTGTTLFDVLARIEAGDAETIARFSRQHLLRAFAEICLAIEFAHTRGVVHRDLKPTNIMLGDFGEVYVLDWGIARVIGDSADRARDPPVEHVDLAEVAEHDVRRLEIAVDDALRERELDRETHVRERAQQATPRRDRILGLAVQQRAQHGAREALHHEERLARAVDAEIVDGHHRGVLEPALDPRLAYEARDRLGTGVLRADPLDRHLAPDLLVDRQHHLAHPAMAEELADPVARAVERQLGAAAAPTREQDGRLRVERCRPDRAPGRDRMRDAGRIDRRRRRRVIARQRVVHAHIVALVDHGAMVTRYDSRMSTTILVTGSAGHLGEALARLRDGLDHHSELAHAIVKGSAKAN